MIRGGELLTMVTPATQSGQVNGADHHNWKAHPAAFYTSPRGVYNVSMGIAAVYIVALVVFGWVMIRRHAARVTGLREGWAWPWLFGAALALVLIPALYDATSPTGWTDSDTLAPSVVSVGAVVVALAWDLWSTRSAGR